MKKKLTTIVLLVVAVGLWGYIGWQVYTRLNHSTDEPKKRVMAPLMAKKDSIPLFLNYRDPFLETEEKKYPSRVASQKLKVNKEIFPDFIYKGEFAIGKRVSVLIEKKGMQQTLSIGDKIDDFSLYKATSDELIVRKGRKDYHLMIQ